MSRTAALTAAAWLLASVVLASPAHAQCTVAAPCVTTPLDLGTLGARSAAGAVNADGSVVAGWSEVGRDNRAFRWTQATGMVNIHTFGGTWSAAFGVNADGSVVVGQADTGTSYHAFRWTQPTGMVSIHNLAVFTGNWSAALGVNPDGSIVVGYGRLVSGHDHAFRWTQATGMVDIHSLAVFPGNISYAHSVSADGSVVAGYGFINPADSHAFRWTQATGMVDLHNLAVFPGNSSTATGTNADGSVVVGWGRSGSGNDHAFRWTQASSMIDIHNGVAFPGDQSQAWGVSADGSVVVGSAYIGPGVIRAFRWTQAAGMANLNTQLTNAGVNMSGIVLLDARGVSADGRFIVGRGTFSGNERAYVVRYDETSPAVPGPPVAPGPPIAGLTSQSSVQQSVNALAASQAQTLIHQHGFAMPLLGADKPMDLENEVGVFASAGSFSSGGHARYRSASGITFLGGLAYASEDYPSAELKNSFLAALAAQYVHDTGTWWRPFVEGGGWLTPNASLSYSRTYANGAGTATGVGNTRGDLSYYYGRAGLVFGEAQSTQFVVSGEIGHQKLELNAYTESDGPQNPFPAAVSAGSDQMNVAKARVQISRSFSDRLDATLVGAWAYGFDRRTDLEAYVLGFGPMPPTVVSDLSWFEFGARLGYRISQATTFDIAISGVSGNDEADTGIHVGAGVRIRF